MSKELPGICHVCFTSCDFNPHLLSDQHEAAIGSTRGPQKLTLKFGSCAPVGPSIVVHGPGTLEPMIAIIDNPSAPPSLPAGIGDRLCPTVFALIVVHGPLSLLSFCNGHPPNPIPMTYRPYLPHRTAIHVLCLQNGLLTSRQVLGVKPKSV